MSDQRYLKVTNNCNETVEVYIRRPRAKKQTAATKGRPSKYTLPPGYDSPPLAEHLLVGAKGWEALRNNECIEIVNVPYEPRFVQIVNTSEERVSIDVAAATEARTREKTTVAVDPDRKSRVIDLKSVAQRRKLNLLVRGKKVLIEPKYDIGPTTGRKGAVASYAGESVYICYECGGPIVFRGSPPTPIHI
jgi:hypothetical protein